MILRWKKWVLSIDLNGGRIIQLKKGNRIILGSFDRIDGKVGNTHLCSPNFGAEGKDLNLPFHGFARQATWQVAKQFMGTVCIGTILPKTLLYPSQLKLTQTFRLNDVFTHIIEITNIGNKKVPVNLGVHYYWDTPEGWIDAHINNVYISELIENNKIIKLSNKFEINFPKQKPLNIEQTGFSNAVLWTGFKTEDNKKTFDHKYCCIEPVMGIGNYFGSEKSILIPGRSIKAEFTIQA